VTDRRRDGTSFPLHLSVGEMVIGGARKFTGVLHDLSDRVNLEKQLRSSEARWRAIIADAATTTAATSTHTTIAKLSIQIDADPASLRSPQHVPAMGRAERAQC